MFDSDSGHRSDFGNIGSLQNRTASMCQVSQLRGLLYEFGVPLKAGRVAGLAEVRERLHEIEQVVPGTLFCALRDQLQHFHRSD